MPLTDSANCSARPQARRIRLFDVGGLYLEISPAGGKWWRWKYRFGGRVVFQLHTGQPVCAEPSGTHSVH